MTWIPHEVGARTFQRYVCSIGQLKPFLEGKYLDEINHRFLTELARARQAADRISNATLKRDLGALSSLLNFAMDQGWQSTNPVLPRLQRIKERRDPISLPSPEDVEKLIQRAPGMLGAMIRAARLTGCRQDELTTLKWANVDLKNKRLTVAKGKGNKLRVIDLEPFGGAAFFASLPAGIANAAVFHHTGRFGPPRKRGPQRYANVSSRFARLSQEIAKADPGFTRFPFHNLRHLHAVEWLRSGRTVYDLQHRFGHSSIKTTEIYLKYLTPEEARVAQGLVPGTKPGTAGATEAKPADQNTLSTKD